MPIPPKRDMLPRGATWANLIVPGSGLIALGRVPAGLIVGAAFALSANAALAARLIVPDDVPGWAQNLAIITACVTYIAAQGLLLGASRPVAAGRVPDTVRRTTMRQIERHISACDFEAARRVIDESRALLDEDLHIAFRRAQVLTELNDPDAHSAWRHLSALDRHGLYRNEWQEALERAASPNDVRQITHNSAE